MHRQIQQKVSGNCAMCGMQQVLDRHSGKPKPHPESLINSYKSLFIIIFLILLPSISLTIKDSLMESSRLQNSMRYFMAGFFVVFSGFKLLDLRGFAIGYSSI